MNDQIPNPVASAKAVPAAPVAAAAAPAGRGAWAGVLTIVIGSLALLALLVGGIWSGLLRGSSAAFDIDLSERASEQISLQLDVGQLDIVFDGDEDTARLEATGRWNAGVEPLTMRNAGDQLVIETARRFNWFGADDHELTGTLHLPARLDGLVDLEADVDVGALTVQGDLARLDADLDVGDLTVGGAVDEAIVDVRVGRASLLAGGGTVTASTNTGQLVLEGDFDVLRTQTDLGRISIDASVRELLTADVSMGDADISLDRELPTRAELASDLGGISVLLPDEPFVLTADSSIRDAARAQGFDIDAGGASEFVIFTGMADVTFRMR